MIRIDPLYLILLAEALLSLAGLTIYLIFLLRKSRSALALQKRQGEDAFNALKQLLDEKLSEVQKEAREAGGAQAPDLVRLKTGYIKASMDAVARGCQDPSGVWQAIYKNFGEVTAPVVAEKLALISERDGLASEKENLQTQLREMTELKDSVERSGQEQSSAAALQQEELNTRIAELEGALAEKEKALASLQSQFDALEQEYLVLYKEENK